MPKIGMILESPFPPNDPRITKEATTLIEAGNEVHLLVPRGLQQAYKDEIDGIHIHRADIGKGIMAKISNEIHRITFMHPIWRRAIYSFLQNTDPDILHVHDLTFAATAIKANQKHLPVVLDLHENYPAAIHAWSKLSFIRKNFTLNYNRLVRHEKAMCDSYDHIITVIDEMKTRLQTVHGISETKISVIPNTEFSNYGKESPELPPKFREMTQERLVLSYVGAWGPHRGLETAVYAMESIIKDIPNALLLLVGGKVEQQKQIQKLIDSLHLNQSIVIAGWQDAKLLPSFMKLSHVGLIPHLSNEHTDNTIPHKLFQYMTLSKPVLVSDCPPLKRVVESTQCGGVFCSGNATDLSRHMTALLGDAERLVALGQNGRSAVETGGWSWETTAQKLPLIHNHLLNQE